jgi:hypothetical protein
MGSHIHMEVAHGFVLIGYSTMKPSSRKALREALEEHSLLEGMVGGSLSDEDDSLEHDDCILVVYKWLHRTHDRGDNDAYEIGAHLIPTEGLPVVAAFYAALDILAEHCPEDMLTILPRLSLSCTAICLNSNSIFKNKFY